MKPQGECLRKSEWEVGPTTRGNAYALVGEFHYAKSGSNTHVYLHGLYRKGNWMNCLGVAWWIPPTKSCAIASFNGDWRRVLSLSRLVLHPSVPANGASFLIGESIKIIRKEGKWDCLLTYADERQGHTGKIYRATNWEYMGLSAMQPTWVDTAGRMVAKKAGPTTRRNSEMKSLGYKCVGTFPKHKFRIVLRPYGEYAHV